MTLYRQTLSYTDLLFNCPDPGTVAGEEQGWNEIDREEGTQERLVMYREEDRAARTVRKTVLPVSFKVYFAPEKKCGTFRKTKFL
jgi:hypothetical protein